MADARTGGNPRCLSRAAWAAAWPRSCPSPTPARRRRRAPSCASIAGRAHRGRTPRSRAGASTRTALAGARRLAERARRAPARPRAPAPGRHLRARRGRAPVARGAAGRARDDARARPARATTRRRSRSRSSRTWPARTSTRSRRRAPSPRSSRSSGLTREEVGRRVGRSRVAISNLLRLLDLPDEALELRRGRARSARATAARCCWPRTTPTAAGWPAPARRGRLVGARARAAGPRGQRRRAPPRARGAAPAVHPDQEAAAAEIAEALGAALGSDVRVRPRGDRLQGRARVRQRRRRARPGPLGSAPRLPALPRPRGRRAVRASPRRSLHSLAARAISSVG